MIDIVISTISREQNQYLFQTLTSLAFSSNIKFSITLIVGNPDVKYLDNFKHNNKISIIPISEDEWNLVKDKGKCEKFNINFYRCLTKVKLSPNSLGVLYLEDDVIFRDDWDLKLIDIISRIELSNYALSLYSAFDLSKAVGEIVQFPHSFYGTQGVFFTSEMLKEFSDKIMNEGILTYRHMADLLLQEYCNDKNIPLYVVKNSLIQHIGEVTAINQNHFHKSISFLK